MITTCNRLHLETLGLIIPKCLPGRCHNMYECGRQNGPHCPLEYIDAIHVYIMGYPKLGRATLQSYAVK